MKTYQTFSSAETKKLGSDLAKKLALSQPKELSRSKLGKTACVVALSGDLGAGKTTFVQGFIRGLGIRGKVTSPTFVLVKRHRIPQRLKLQTSNFQHIHHADFYRLASAAHLKPLAPLEASSPLTGLEFKKVLDDPKNIVLIEWPEKVKGAISKNAIKVLFQYGKQENERIIKID